RGRTSRRGAWSPPRTLWGLSGPGLRRHPKVAHNKGPSQDARRPAPPNPRRKKSSPRQHRGDRREPDHRAPGGSKPKADGGHEIDDRKKHGRSLPGDRTRFERNHFAEADAAHLGPVIQTLDHRDHCHRPQEQNKPFRPAANRPITLMLANRLERPHILGRGGTLHEITSSAEPSGAK